MKKNIAILLALLLLLSFTACSGGENVSTRPSADNDREQNLQGAENMQQDLNKPRTFNKTATIEETVLYDENGVKITATGLSYNNYAVELELLIENNSGKNLFFIAGSLGYSCNSVNGYMMPGYLNCDVADGKKANDSISLNYSDLMIYGIYEIADMEIGIDISDDDFNHTYTGPRRIVTSAAIAYDYDAHCYRETISSRENQKTYGYTMKLFDDEAVYEENGLRILSQTLLENQNGETILLLEVVNDTEQMVGVSTTNIAINGLQICDSTWSHDTINPGKTAIIDVNLSSILEPDFWPVYGIGEIGTVELDVIFKDSENEEIAFPASLRVTNPGAENALDKSGHEICNSSGVRIVSKGVYKDPSDYSDDLHLLLLAENTTDQTLLLREVYGSMSINDYMSSASFYSVKLAPNSVVMVDVRFWAHNLEEVDVSTPEDIEKIDFQLTIETENYKELEEASISIVLD